jgi:hypothetical protein
MFAFITKETYLFMKKFQLLNWMLVAFLAFQFSACEDEPLEGEFPQEEVNEAGEGEFVATVGGEAFMAESATAVMNDMNDMVIIGTRPTTGETITLVIENAAVGTFDITAGTGNENSGSYSDTSQQLNPYISAGVFGGSGQLNITEIDTDAFTVTGTFSFVGVRIQLDSEGNPVIDGDGNPVLETIAITNGAFNSIELDINGGPGSPVGTNDDFFAKVDGIDFTPDLMLAATRVEIGGIPVINIVAVNAAGDQMRIDIPENTGTGTFAMESISDGTKLIGLYNAAGPGEALTSNPGTITITQFNTLAGLVEGTFAFTATDPLNQDPTVVEITEGTFSVHYEAAASNPNNSFIADIGGEAMGADFVDATEFDLSGVPTVTVRGYSSTSGENIEITFPKDLAPGSYDFVSEQIPGESVAIYQVTVGGTSYVSTDGAIVVITNDLATGGTINAAFLFFAEDLSGTNPETFTITNGEFTVELE